MLKYPEKFSGGGTEFANRYITLITVTAAKHVDT